MLFNGNDRHSFKGGTIMKFRETIKFGFGAYIGWELAKIVDTALGERLWKSGILSNNDKEKSDDEKETD